MHPLPGDQAGRRAEPMPGSGRAEPMLVGGLAEPMLAGGRILERLAVFHRCEVLCISLGFQDSVISFYRDCRRTLSRRWRGGCRFPPTSPILPAFAINCWCNLPACAIKLHPQEVCCSSLQHFFVNELIMGPN